jgi:membrane protease YdiL (CAAX protease family)
MTPRAEVLPTLGRVVAFAVLLVLCATAASSLLAPLARQVIVHTGQPLRLEVLPNLLGAFAATALMLRSIDRRPWSAVDLDRAAARPAMFAQGFALGAGPIILVCGVLLLGGWLVFMPATVSGSWVTSALMTTLVLAPAALAEEVMCRGYLLTVTRECIGVQGAIVTTSVLFGVLHLQNPDATLESVLVVITAGVFLASVRVYLRSLYAAWMAHFAWNWVMAVPVHARVSGLGFDAPGYVAVTTDPAWVSGGNWGPEGGIVAALGLIAGLAYLYSRQRREES